MNAEARPGKLFALGELAATPGALALLERADLPGYDLLMRHVAGDFGELCAEDVAANERAVVEGARIFSAYIVAGERLWVITEADRSVTTLLLPSEY